ncbi:MAG: hypothetical protein IT373_12630 [Polyangiaceae bacterium]|nr:hypothetical protein [Polyangiaceae bacterium]
MKAFTAAMSVTSQANGAVADDADVAAVQVIDARLASVGTAARVDGLVADVGTAIAVEGARCIPIAAARADARRPPRRAGMRASARTCASHQSTQIASTPPSRVIAQ